MRSRSWLAAGMMMLVLLGASQAQSTSQAAPTPAKPVAPAPQNAPPAWSQPPAVPPKGAPAGDAKPEPEILGDKDKDKKAAGDNDVQDTGTIIKKRVEEVNVIFTVTDKRGHYVRNLKKDEIQVLDDKRPPKAIVDFRSETDLPLRVGLLIDTSSSVRDRFKFEQESAVEFLNQVVRPQRDKAFVLGFDVVAEVTQDFTSDTNKLSKGVRSLRPGGGTALLDAIYYACRDKLQKESAGQTVRRAIILLSDGDDNHSRVSVGETVEMAQRAEVIVYSISTNVSGTVLRGDKVLKYIAESTGGRAFFPFKIEDVSNAFSDISEELRSQYSVSYRPAELSTDGRYHTIDINAQNRKLKVRSRRGYFAPKG